MKTRQAQQKFVARLSELLSDRILLMRQEGKLREIEAMRPYENVIEKATSMLSLASIEEPELLRNLNKLDYILSQPLEMSNQEIKHADEKGGTLKIKVFVLDYLLFERLYSEKKNRFNAATRHKVLAAILSEKVDSVKKAYDRAEELKDPAKTTPGNKKHRIDIISTMHFIAKDLLADKQFETLLQKLKTDTERA